MAEMPVKNAERFGLVDSLMHTDIFVVLTCEPHYRDS